MTGSDGAAAEWCLLVLRSEDCPACDVLEATTLADAQVREVLRGVKVQVVSADDHPEFARRYLATALPRLIFLRDGVPEETLMGALAPEQFLEQWRRIRTGGSGTVSAWWAEVHANPKDALRRSQLGIKLALGGDVEGAQIQLNTLAATAQPCDSDFVESLWGSINNARYMRLRDDVLRARAQGEIPAGHALHGLVVDAKVPPGTRYKAGRMLAGILNERVVHSRDGARLDALRGQRRLVLGIAWICCPRPLGTAELGFGLDVHSLLWTERDELGGSDRELAQRVSSDMHAAFPDDIHVQVAVIRSLWIVGRRDEALHAARGLDDVAERGAIVAELEALAP